MLCQSKSLSTSAELVEEAAIIVEIRAMMEIKNGSPNGMTWSWMLRLLDVWYNAFYVEEEYDDQADYDDRWLYGLAKHRHWNDEVVWEKQRGWCRKVSRTISTAQSRTD